jgi:phosphate transport system substrate-binding protein
MRETRPERAASACRFSGMILSRGGTAARRAPDRRMPLRSEAGFSGSESPLSRQRKTNPGKGLTMYRACFVPLLSVAAALPVSARDHIQIAGSSTVLPYASIVAEAFGENFDFRNPVVEAGGSSAGLKKFCQGVGESQIDIANASRRIKPAEIAACAGNGVTEIMEVRIGYDGIVFASSIAGSSFAFTPSDWYRALAAQVVVGGDLVANPYSTWKDVNPDLPAQEIQAFVPGTKHGTREVFETRVIEQGCHDSGAADVIAARVGKERVFETCTRLRTDGHSVDIDGDYTETLARVSANPAGIGVFGLAFYENNTDSLRVATMSGVLPSTESIASGDYPVSRPLFFYLKTAHLGVIPGLKEFAGFFVSDDVAGPDGPLAAYGLVPDPDLAATQAAVAAGTAMTSD